jgi:hypothetical protein
MSTSAVTCSLAVKSRKSAFGPGLWPEQLLDPPAVQRQPSYSCEIGLWEVICDIVRPASFATASFLP